MTQTVDHSLRDPPKLPFEPLIQRNAVITEQPWGKPEDADCLEWQSAPASARPGMAGLGLEAPAEAAPWTATPDEHCVT
jgi:hypothetical protein